MWENDFAHGLIIAIVISLGFFSIPFLYERIRYYRFYKKCNREFVDSLIQNGRCDIYDLAMYFGVDSVTVRFHLMRMGYHVNSLFVYRVEK